MVCCRSSTLRLAEALFNCLEEHVRLEPCMHLYTYEIYCHMKSSIPSIVIYAYVKSQRNAAKPVSLGYHLSKYVDRKKY